MVKKTVEAFIKDYVITEPMSNAQRAAKFLHDLAEHYPKDYCNKRVLVRIAFNLDATPKESNIFMKKLHYIVQSAERHLERDHNQYIVSDPVDGYRATVDSYDAAQTKHRKAVRGIDAAAARAQRIGEHIDVNKLHGPLKKEFQDSSQAIKRITGIMSNLPQLPPVKKEDDERKPK